MKPTLKHILAAVVLLLSFAAPVAAGPFEDAVAARDRGDYATAVRLLRPLADHGEAPAQRYLGAMIRNGEGVRQDTAEAVKWYRKAADQGDALAQRYLGASFLNGDGVPLNYAEAVKWLRLAANQGESAAQVLLGLMYTKGNMGVLQDYVLGYMWFNLAAAQNEENAAGARDETASLMTPAQIAEAQKLAREWKPTKQTPVSSQTQETKGAPQVLIGKWGNSARQCRSYHRKSDDISSIYEDEYDFCGGSACGATILGYQKTPDGYDLKLGGGSNVWQLHVRVINENAIEMIRDASPGEMLVRCTKSDGIAGIGLGDTSAYEKNNVSLDAVFAGYYALAIPTQCPHLAPNVSAAEAIIRAGGRAWTKFLLEQPNENYHFAEQGIQITKREAESAVRLDAGEIKNFCDEVLGAFGNGGRVLPNLIKDPRKKS